MYSLVKEQLNQQEPKNRPRERMIRLGAQALSDQDLMALILGSGLQGRDVYSVANDVLKVLEQFPDLNVDQKSLNSIPGIGNARSSAVLASLEFARRRIRPAKKRIEYPRDVYPIIRHWADRPQEMFLVLSLNGAHEVLQVRVVSQGILDRTLVHPREVFIHPLSDRASAIICAHNHPSGSLTPSQDDKELTLRLEKAGELLGIPVLDHVIFTEEGFYSFHDQQESSLFTSENHISRPAIPIQLESH
ncbi:MAG: DNA repair protein RadC [Spirochaetales bacterium]|nr:DNA repair protein RadC [Spirochaetales bacterium]